MNKSRLISRIAAVAAAAVMSVSALPAGMGITAAAADITYSITTEVTGSGQITATPSDPKAGENVTLTAEPAEGCTFDHWEITSTGSTSYSKTASVVFVLDTTGSMESRIKKVRNNLINLVTELDAKGIGLNIAIIEFSDAKHYDGSTLFHTFANGTNWTTDVTEAVNIFSGITTGKGYSETPTDAFTQLLRADGTFNFPADSANNYIFLLTDETYSDFADNEENAAKNRFPMATWIDKLKAANIKVSVATFESLQSDFSPLYTATGGMFINIKSKDYSQVMKDFSDYLDQTSQTIQQTSTANPYTFPMPACNLNIKAVFSGQTRSAHSISVSTNGHGTAFASQSSAYSGELISIGQRADDGYVLDSITCTSGGAVINGSTFVMPDSDVTVYVTFKEDTSKYIASALPHSYVFSYDKDMNLISTNSNRSFEAFPEYVEIKIDLGADFAGRTGNICAGRKSSGKVIESITLDENGCYVFKADAKKNYSFVLD